MLISKCLFRSVWIFIYFCGVFGVFVTPKNPSILYLLEKLVNMSLMLTRAYRPMMRSIAMSLASSARGFTTDGETPRHSIQIGGAQASPSAFYPLSATKTLSTDYPLSEGNVSGVVVYDAHKVNVMLAASSLTSGCPSFNQVASEWVRVLDNGPGVFVVKGAFGDHGLLDRVTKSYLDIVDFEKETSKGDHFSKAGNNDRIWNSLEKLAVHDPEAFLDYYNNKIIAAISRAWLGPDYQMTSQVNSSHPGSAAQDPHCDYHLGFRSNDSVAEFPIHVHRMSQYLTLQGAIAHVDMPLESGPTTFLPYSQNFERNYLTWRDPSFREYYRQNLVQLSLEKGDAVFFNPGLIHAAGENISSDVERLANLIQVNSAFGRCMESIDTGRMCRAVYPHLRERVERDGVDAWMPAISVTAEGNAFPANLDRATPQGSEPPKSQIQSLVGLLKEGADDSKLDEELNRWEWERQTS